MIRTLTAIINDGGNEHYVGRPDWSRHALNHNERHMPTLDVIDAKNSLYVRMKAAATNVYGENIRLNWGFGTLANYLALRLFLEIRGDSLIWIEADMIRNQHVPLPRVRGVCQTEAWGNPDHTPTPYEIHKRKFCEAFVPNPRRPYKHFMSSWLWLDRDQVWKLVNGMHAVGLDLLASESWERIRATELEIGVPEFRFVCDMMLELSWMVSDWEFDNVFDQLGWVSYTEDYLSRPIIHFDGPHKPEITRFLGCQNKASS